MLTAGVLVVAIIVLVAVLTLRRRTYGENTSSQGEDPRPASTFLSQALNESHTPGVASTDLIRRFLRQAFPDFGFELGEYTLSGFRSVLRVHDGKDLPNYDLNLSSAPGHLLTYLRSHPDLLMDEDSFNDRDLGKWPELDRLEGAQALILPLKHQDEAIGVLALKSRKPVTDDEIALVRSVRPMVSLLLKDLQLGREVEIRATQLFLIGEISRRLISLKPLETRMAAVCPLISQIFDYSEVAIYRWDEDGAMLMASSHEVDDRETHDQDATSGIVGDSAREGRRKEAGVEHATPGGQSAEVALPLMIEDRLLGVLHIRDQHGRELGGERLAIAEMIGAQLAIAALEARNYSSQQEYTWINTVLLEVARHAAQPGDPADAVRAVLQLTTLLAGADWAAVFLRAESDGALHLGPNAGLDRDTVSRIETQSFDRAEFGLGEPPAESQAPIPIEVPQYLRDELRLDSPLGLVMSDGRDLLGILLLGGPEPVGPRRALLAGIGHQISLRLENARLVDELATQRSLERELVMARGIQESFLPGFVPHVPGWDFGATWLVAREVGGDFFDFIDLPKTGSGARLGIAIADVADKGIPASLFMAVCITLLRSVATTLDSPGAVLARMNELLFLQARPDMFVSIFYGVLDLNHGTLAYANGGHNPPFLVDEEGKWMLLREHGMVLGVSEQATYDEHRIHFDKGMRLVLYTDGVTEATSRDGELFGTSRLSEQLRTSGTASSQDLAEMVNHAVALFCSGEPSDDLTTVIVKREAIPRGPKEHPDE